MTRCKTWKKTLWKAGIISDGELRTGSHTVTLHDANRAVLGAQTEVGTAETDGMLVAPQGVLLGSGKALLGRGVVSGSVQQSPDSIIAATGQLTLGRQ